MLYFKSVRQTLRYLSRVTAIILLGFLASCQFEPLHGNRSSSGLANGKLASVQVSQVNNRVGQQVRNRLLFLLNGGNDGVEKTHEARLRISWHNTLLDAIPGDENDSSAGTITVTVSYDLVDLSTGKAIGRGTRKANASYDRSGQVFANTRAERDAENRAAKEAAEALRFAIASDLSNVKS